MSSSKRPTDRHSSSSNDLFEIVSACQIMLIVGAIIWGAYHLLFISQGGYMGIGKVIFIGAYLPSILLLIPTLFLVKNNRRLSSVAKVASYCYYGVTLAWGVFLLRIPFL